MNKQVDNIIRCYACTKESTSREHVPPKCFFPKGHRKNLITVPSCKKHTQDNSEYVEYVRDIITICFQVNKTGTEQFENKTFRSVTRNSRLIDKLFKNLSTVYLNGSETGSTEADLDIFDKVFNLIGKALYFYDFGKRFTHKFKVLPASFFSKDIAQLDQTKQYYKMIKTLNLLKYEKINTENPKVFRYDRYREDKNNIVYRLLFYEGFIIFLVFTK